MQVRLLGPVDVVADAGPRPVHGLRRMAVLATLAGLHPGPDIGLAAAASLAGTRPGQARVPLDELTQAHLLAEHIPGRYTCHDLLRAYAMEQALA